MVNNLPATLETWVPSLGWEDPLEKEMATSILAWRIPQTEEPGRLQSMRSQRIRHDCVHHTHGRSVQRLLSSYNNDRWYSNSLALCQPSALRFFLLSSYFLGTPFQNKRQAPLHKVTENWSAFPLQERLEVKAIRCMLCFFTSLKYYCYYTVIMCKLMQKKIWPHR